MVDLFWNLFILAIILGLAAFLTRFTYRTTILNAKVPILLEKDDDENLQVYVKKKIKELPVTKRWDFKYLIPLALFVGITLLLMGIGISLLSASGEQIQLIEDIFSYITLFAVLLSSIYVLPIFIRKEYEGFELEEYLKPIHLLYLFFAIIIVVMVGIYLYGLSALDFLAMFLLMLGAISSGYISAKYAFLFAFRMYFKAKGWDFISDEKIDLSNKILTLQRKYDGYFMLFLVGIAPFLAVYYFVSILMKNVDKAGFIGEYVLTHFAGSEVITFIVFFLLPSHLIIFLVRPFEFLELSYSYPLYHSLEKITLYKLKEKDLKDDLTLPLINSRYIIVSTMLYFSMLIYVAILGTWDAASKIAPDTFVFHLNLLFVEVKSNKNVIPIVQFFEILIFLPFTIMVFNHFKEEKDLWKTAEASMDLSKDMFNMKFWAIKKLINGEYKIVEEKMLKNLYLDDKINYFAHFYLGISYYLQGDPANALYYLKRFLEFFPNHIDALMYVGYCFEDLGELDVAHQIYKKVVFLDKSNFSAVKHLHALKEMVAITPETIKKIIDMQLDFLKDLF